MKTSMGAAGLNAVMVVALLGCNDAGRQRDLALQGAGEFWKEYNDGEFGSLYDRASNYVHRMVNRDQWVADCMKLRARVGKCGIFSPEKNNEYLLGRPGIVWVSGRVACDGGSVRVRLDWDIASNRPLLNNVKVDDDGKEILSIPGFREQYR